MQRIFYGLGLLAAVLLLGGVLFNAANNPMETRRVALASELTAMGSDWKLDEGLIVSPSSDLEISINGKPAVWRQLIARPIPPVRPPNMASILKGVQPTRMSIGVGADRKVKIITPSKRRGDFFKVGSRVVGTRISEITDTDVTFSLKKNGKEYKKSLPRK
jgi:hypothetical protein